MRSPACLDGLPHVGMVPGCGGAVRRLRPDSDHGATMRGRDFWLLITVMILAPHLPLYTALGTGAYTMFLAWRCASKGD